MLSHRLRALAAVAPVFIAAGLIVAAPGLAAQSLRILSPLSGATVAGTVQVSGTADGSAGSPISVELAPQRFGDCGAPIVEQSAVVSASGAFATTISSDSVADGTYCIIVTVGDGRLSTAIGDVTVLNDSGLVDSLDGTQLPTRVLGDGQASSADVALAAIADVQFLAPIVVGAAATLAFIVLVFTLSQRRRTE